MDEGSNRSFHDSLDDDNICGDFLDGKNCISCDEGGEVLVCAERDCPVSLHAKCLLCIEPKFDDMGNFYCPYCWYKRARAEAQESRKKAFLAKKDLSKFFCLNGITSDKMAENDAGVKVSENRPGNKSADSQPLKIVRDQQKRKERVMADADQHGIAVEDEAYANGPETNTGDSKYYGEENAPVHIHLVQKSSNREKFDILNNNITGTHEPRFVEGQEGIEPEDLGYYNEYVHATIVEDAKPVRAFHFGEDTEGCLPDNAFAKGLQKGVEVYEVKGRVKDREKLVQNELNWSGTDCSVSENCVSDSEPLPMKESCIKQQEQRTAYIQRLRSVRKSLPLKSKIGSENVCFKNEEVFFSETLGPPESKRLSLQTGKRKRLIWTVEEENMLKEGVLRFSMDQRNIPWKKILEFGRDVFDSKRNTADLKDKWKHMRV